MLPRHDTRRFQQAVEYGQLVLWYRVSNQVLIREISRRQIRFAGEWMVRIHDRDQFIGKEWFVLKSPIPDFCANNSDIQPSIQQSLKWVACGVGDNPNFEARKFLTEGFKTRR